MIYFLSWTVLVFYEITATGLAARPASHDRCGRLGGGSQKRNRATKQGRGLGLRILVS